MGAAALWNTTEALLAEQAPVAMRGRVMGLYQTAMGAALAAGPFVPGVLRLQAQDVLWLAVLLMAGCLLLALTAPAQEPVAGARAATGTWQALRAVPWLVVIAFAGGAFEAGLGAISAAHASGQGMSLRAAASVAGVIGIGSFLVQYPAGWAADRIPLRSVCTAAAIGLLFAGVAVGFAGEAPWLLPGLAGVLGFLALLTLVAARRAVPAA